MLANAKKHNILTMCTFNVNGLGDKVKRKALFKNIRDANTDVCFLQETQCTEKTHTLWLNEWGGEMHCSHGSSNSCGVAILIRRGLNLEIKDQIMDPLGRFLILKYTYDQTETAIVNVYAPTQDKEYEQIVFLSKIRQELFSFQDLTILVGGDFNIALNPNLDRYNSAQPYYHSRRYREELLKTMQDFDLIDYWREQNPNIRRFTFHRKQQRSRLDFWLIPDHFKNKIRSCSIKLAIHSDHCPVTLEILKKEEKRGPGLWKINNTIIKEPDYVKGLKNLIKEFGENHLNSNPNMKWDFLKFEIKTFSIRYSSEKRKKEKQQEKELSTRLKELLENVDETTDEVKCETLKKELEFIQNKKAQATIFRSRCNWSQLNEKPTKYFLNLEKINFNDKLISQLKKENGIITDQSKEILNMIHDYYSELYTNKESEEISNDDSNLFLNAENVSQLSDTQKKNLDLPISVF